MSMALHLEVQRLGERIDEVTDQIKQQSAEIEALGAEIIRLQVAKRPDRPPIRVPKPPRVLRSIGVGLDKG